MDKNDIINHALALAEQAHLSSAVQGQSDHISKTFDLYYGSLLSKRKWIWAHDVVQGSQLQLTEDGATLGYKYKYTFTGAGAVNLNVKDVIALNRDGTRVNASLFRSREEALDFGYTLPDEPIDNLTSTSSFLFLNNILHTDCEITQVLVKKTVDPSALPDEVKELLAYQLATVFARTIKKDANLSKDLRAEADELFVAATRDENKAPSNPHLRGVYEWLLEYYSQTALNRNYN